MNNPKNPMVIRLIDANFNRAREGLRVMEDCARFLLNDAALSSLAKNLRHKLSQSISNAINNNVLCWSRDTAGDVGTAISTPAEQQRSDPKVVVIAAAKRLTEALRCIEEYSKITHPRLAGQVEQIRYQAYHLEKLLTAKIAVGERFKAVKLYVLLTSSLCRKPILEVASDILAAGVDCIQLREKDLTDKDLVFLARQICQSCHEHETLFLMNDRPDLALLAQTDGVHLGQDDLSVAQARQIIHPGKIVGKSTHSQAELTAALAESPDYVAIGAIFSSPTKASVPAIGLDALRQMVPNAPCPVIAIGGITPENAPDVIAAGASGIAVCQAVIAAGNPDRAVELFRRNITR